ncbi:MAG: AAA family ATPase [Anaerolineae bacterium]|nr:AAA family ATPase [Anaerolineae bacterium]
MAELKVQLLGSPQIEINSESVKINRRKAMALLAYLAVTRHSHNRDALATLFWPETPHNRARANLRQTLWELNNALGEPWIATEDETLALRTDPNVWVDVHAFQASLVACQTHGHPIDQACADCVPLLTELITLYRDDFLAGFSLPDSPAFDEWQYLETEDFRRKFADGLENLGDYLIGIGDFEAAIAAIRRWSALDPLNDTPHYRLLQLYAWTDQRAAAVRQYRKYTKLLKQELGLGPREDISILYQRIRRGEAQQQKVSPALDYKIADLVGEQPAAPAAPELSLRAKDEIRLSTVLVVGLSNADAITWDFQPEDMAGATQSLLQIVTQVITRYEGQIVHFAGYNVQAIFGMVQSHEDDPERAVYAALEIQRLAKKDGIGLSVGISTGHVYLGPIGPAKFQDVAALGPVVQLASRLQDQAPTGQVVVSESAYRHIQGVFEFAPKLMTVRGMEQPIEVYEVKQALPRPQKMRGIKGLRATLIGRDEEFAKLNMALTAVLAGQGQLVSLIGEAGVGKSRLVEELNQSALPPPLSNTPVPLWLECRCSALRTATGFWPFIDLLQRYLYTSQGAANEIERGQALAACLATMKQQDRLGGDDRRAGEIRTLLSRMLSLELEPEWQEWVKAIDAQSLQHQTFLAVTDFFTALAVDQPLVLVFDDLHWVDDLSFDLVSSLMDALRTSPILLLCVYRPHYQHKDLRLSAIASRKCPEQYLELMLRELTPDQSRRLIDSLLGVDVLPPAVEAPVLQRTHGNPFFIEEVIRELIENGILYVDQEEAINGHRWRVRAEIDPVIAVPKSVQSVILSRIDRLEPEPKHLLRSAAVIGHSFQTRILSQLIPQMTDLRQMLWRLEESALIYREKVVPEEEYVFRHGLIQESVYQTIPPDQKTHLHQQVAEVIEQQYQDNLAERYEQLAYHYQRSKLTGKAVQYLCRAGEKSRRIFLNDEAVRYFKQALQQLAEMSTGPVSTLDRSRWRLVALTGLGRTYHRLGKETEAEYHFRQAIALGEETGADTPTLIRLYHWLGEVLFWQEQHTERAELGLKGLALLTAEETESVEAALMNQLIAMSRIRQGDMHEFHTWTAQTARFIRNLPYREELRPAYFHIGISLYYQKRLTEAAHWLQTVGAWAKQFNDHGSLAELYDLEFSFDFQQGDLQTAMAKVERVIALYRQSGQDRRIWYSLQDIIGVCLHLGDFSAAERYAQQALELAEGVGLDKYRSVSLLMIGVIRLAEQAWQTAAETLNQTIQSASDVYPWTVWTAHYSLGQIDRFQGRPQAALNHFKAAMTLFDASDLSMVAWVSRWPFLACILTGLEAVYEAAEGDSQGVKSLYQSFAALPTQPSTGSIIPQQWYLEPVAIDKPHLTPDRAAFYDQFEADLDLDWTWRDPLADCTFCVQTGLDMRAANGRDLWYLNLSAPRLLRPVVNDFVVQTICRPADSQQPAIGGLLLWQDEFNFLRLVWGCRGNREVAFDGSIDNRTIIVGRGLLPENHSDCRVFLRLARQENSIQAFCSRDGSQWFSVGQVSFPVTGPLEIGLHAVGWIDRLTYPGSYPTGAAIHFESFCLWQ